MKTLKKYLNLDAINQMLLIAWISYTLAHPKLPTTKYLILLINSGQGTGKTSLCNNIIIPLIDPSRVGVQVLPKNGKDLAIALQNAHVLCFDNVRGLSFEMADNICIASTGGAITSRTLYTDGEQHVIPLHGALILNGIHSFVDQPDFAERCLSIELLSIERAKRKSDVELVKDFQVDLPKIRRELFTLISDIFLRLPDVEVTHPGRMIDFVKWLAAMEKVHGAPLGAYQACYSESINHGQLDSLLDNTLAAAVLDLAEKLDDEYGNWSGTPAELLEELNAISSRGTQKSRSWPQNPISLSKRLAPLQAGLMTQGVKIEFTRGKHRTITIKTQGEKR